MKPPYIKVDWASDDVVRLSLFAWLVEDSVYLSLYILTQDDILGENENEGIKVLYTRNL